MWRLRSIGGCLQFGAAATIARRWGEGNVQRACSVFSHSVLLSFLIGLFFVCLFIPGSYTLFPLLNAKGELFDKLVPYFHLVLLVLPFRLASFTMMASLRAAGDTKTPMLTTLAINIVNVFFNWCLIFGNLGFPKLGLYGAGVATCIALLVEFGIMSFVGFRGIRPRKLFAAVPVEATTVDEEIEPSPSLFATSTEEDGVDGVFKLSKSGWKLYIPTTTASIFRISHPAFWEEIAISIGFFIFFGMIGSFGDLAYAVHTSIIRIESFSFMAGYGVSIAASTLVGQALGARDKEKALRSFSMCISIGMSIMGFIGILLCLFPEWFLGWFVSDQREAFMGIGIPLMIITALSQPLTASTMVLANGLRGAGETTYPFIAQMIGVIGIRAGLGYLLAFPLNLGLQGIYIAMAFDWVVRTAILALIVLKGNWSEKEV